MRALLITSRVTFVPRNYDSFVIAMAESPQIAGLVVLDNVTRDLWLKACLLGLAGAHGLGLQLLQNLARWRSHERGRREAFARRGKGFWVLPSINAGEARELVAREQIDLLVNARTRCIFGSSILEAPRLGCINLHHGLLPDQRGVMCDLWALSRGEQAGFSIHRMTPKVDDGEVLCVTPVSHGESDYAAHLSRSAEREARVVTELLDTTARTDAVGGVANPRTHATVYRRNPTLKQLRSMLAAGVRL